MSGETANIADVANIVSKDIFEYFKWERIPIMDENFPCHKPEEHKKSSGKRKITSETAHQHLVDVVFRYYDPYLNKYIMLNTDLKSLGASSIKQAPIRGALHSLAKTIDCAKSSVEWRKKYLFTDDPIEVRGLLFVYNHDGSFNSSFNSILKGIKQENLELKSDQLIHIIEPERIRYLTTVVKDIQLLQLENRFPRKQEEYSFYYPDLCLHKAQGDPDSYSASIEMICSPYMILKHGPFKGYDPETEKIVSCGQDGGFLIYYNQDGSTEYEFEYLFDSLSRFQILNSKSAITIRIAHNSPSQIILSNYEKAKRTYLQSWGFDPFRNKCLERIDLEIVPTIETNYMPGHLAWRF